MDEIDIVNLESNKNISDEEILKDIQDTQREIIQLEEKNRSNIKGIAERHTFIGKLNYLLNLRTISRIVKE